MDSPRHHDHEQEGGSHSPSEHPGETDASPTDDPPGSGGDDGPGDGRPAAVVAKAIGPSTSKSAAIP